MKVYGNFHSSIFNSLRLLSTVLIVTLVFMLQGSAFAGEQVIYNFLGGNDGIGSSDLVADQAGNLYGTSFDGGGPAGAGTVYELSPPAQQGGNWSETILYAFSYAGLGTGIGPSAGFGDGLGGQSVWHDVAGWSGRGRGRV